MPYKIKLNNFPVGIVSSIDRINNTTKIIVNEFTSSEDGDRFINRLEGIANILISKIPKSAKIKPSTIDHLLAIIRKDLTATIYINEIEFEGISLPKRELKKGDDLYVDDIVNIYKYTPKDITLPDDCGIVFIFSIGWRKGFYYDFLPLLPPSFRKREHDLEIIFGRLYSQLLFQNYYKITDSEWEYLLKEKWFPFISLTDRTIKKILQYTRSKLSLDTLLPHISEEVSKSLNSMSNRWKKISDLDSHVEFIHKSIERYKNRDYISSISVLYPRIEGIMRDSFYNQVNNQRATQTNLSQSITDIDQNTYPILLPEKFKLFLTDVYFADFDPANPDGLSRHTVGHGVAKIDEFSLKGSIIGFLILDQLSYYLRVKKD